MLNALPDARAGAEPAWAGLRYPADTRSRNRLPVRHHLRVAAHRWHLLPPRAQPPPPDSRTPDGSLDLRPISSLRDVASHKHGTSPWPEIRDHLRPLERYL